MKKMIYSAALILTLSLGACSNAEDYSPQEILNQAMQETSDINSYYGEFKMELDGENPYTGKQWEKNGKIRIETVESNGDETVNINDGTTITSYNKTTNSGFIFKLDENDPEGFTQSTLKEQAQKTLGLVKDTHDISVGKDEKIAGRDTYHLIAKAKKSDSLIGDMEIWVDKKTWMTLKTVSTTEDMHMTMEYTKFEPNAKIDDAQFVADIPADADMQVEQIGPADQITIEEAKELLGNFLTFPEKDGLSLLSIEDMDVAETGEIALTYLKNGDPAFTLSIFKPADPLAPLADEAMEVRGLPGAKMDAEYYRFLHWDEEGLRYGIIFDNLDLTYEEVLALTEQMEMVQ
jgi:outer membrane lipoprotein-sorting protein